MSRTLRPLAALALVALIADQRGLCRTHLPRPAPAAAPAPPAAPTERPEVTDRDKAVKFAECMRDNGVSDVPGPGRVGRLRPSMGSRTARRWTRTPRRSSRPSARARTWSHRGSRARKRSPKQQTAALKFAQCMRDNGVKDFPDPTNGEPLVDTNRIPSAATAGGMTILNAAMQKCRASRGRGSGRASEAEDAGCWPAAAVLVAAAATGGVVVMSGARAGDRGRAGAAGEHRDGGAGEALGHGLPGRDPDLSGATGRLAVRRDQPGPRDVHRAARRSATRSTAATCSIGWTTSPVLLLCGTVPAYRDAAHGRLRATTSASSTATCTARLRRRAQLDRSHDTLHLETANALEKLQRTQGRAT